MKSIIAMLLAFVFSASGQSFRISQFPKTTNVTDEALFIVAVTNTTPATNYSVRYANLKEGITNGLVTTNMLYAATNTLFEYTTNAIAASGSGDGTVSNLNTLTAELPLIGNGAGQIKSISVASNYSILNLTNFVELEQVKWRATRQRKPWIGFDTFYSSWNGSNTAEGMILGSGSNIYCGPSDQFLSVMMTNMINSGLHARGLNLISINDGWQCAKGDRVGGVITVNSNRFPNGMLAFVNKAHAMGYKVRLYNDITPAGSCCGLEPFTNIVVDAQTLKDWKIDALTIDTCGAGGLGGSDDAKRDLHLNFIAALKNVGWNGSYEVHFNVGQTTEQYTNYYAQWPLMQNTFQHTREWGDLYGGLTNWWGEALDHIDTIQHVMGGLRPGHHPQMGYLDGMSQDGFIAGVQWSTIYHFGWMNYFMQAMHQSDLIFSLDYTAHPFVQNRRFQTNDYLYRIQQDDYYDPPTKIAINGDCEIWSKHLDDGSVAFSIINRAISVSSLGNHFATTPQSIDLNLRGFGVRSNEVSYMVDCINFTNRLVTDLTTFTCATNTFQQWIWYPERNFTIPRGNLIIGGTNQTGPGMVKLMDASASGGATIIRSDSTGASLYDGNNSARVNLTAANLLATEQILISDGSVRITNSGIAVLNAGHAGIDNTNHLSIDTVAGNNSLVVSTNGKTYGTFVGDGSGLTGGAFPLTADANFGGFSGTNIGSLQVTGRVSLVATVNSNGGVIYKGTNQFIHDFKPATGDGYNVFVGNRAGNFTMSPSGGNTYEGSQNVGIGDDTVQSITTGYRNVGVGWKALMKTTVGYHNTAVGTSALSENTSGTYNTALGIGSLLYNISGEQNTGLGADTLFSNTNGYFNVAVGRNAMFYNLDGSYNVAVGANSLFTNNGSYNVAVGNSVLVSNTIGIYNVGVGPDALIANASGERNVAVGRNALGGNTTGNANTAIGDNTGIGITTGTGNTILGANISGLSSNLTNNIIVSDGAGNQRIRVDGSGNVGVGTATPVDRLTVGSVTGQNVLKVNGVSSANGAPVVSFFRDAAAEWVIAGHGGGASGFSIVDNPISYSDANLNTAARMTFLTGGNVGIGKTAPTAKLEIAGTSTSKLFVVNTNMLVVTNGNVGIGTATPASFFTVDGGASGTTRFIRANKFFIINPNNGGGDTDANFQSDAAMAITFSPAGSETVRFGVAAGVAKLGVTGDIRASTTIVATNGFASYATNRVAIAATGYTNTLTVSSLPVNVDVYFSGATAALYDQNGTLIHTYVVAVTGDTYAKMKPNWRLVGTTMVGDAVAQ